MHRLLARARSFWRTLRHADRLDGDMEAEMQHHLDLEAERLVRERGLAPGEARRQAAIAFGGVAQYTESGRDVLGVARVRGLSLDVRLGLRMLVRHPGLTIVALLALSIVIGAGAAYLEFLNDVFRPTLPFADGHRIVGIQHWDAETGKAEDRALHDFVSWRGQLRAFDTLGAYRPLDRTLITADDAAEATRGAAISASAFRMLGIPPLLGRPLLEDDERPNAPPVALLGFDLWQARFASDPHIVGQTIRLGRAMHTVVGVMPAGFGFPVSHSLWVPLGVNDPDYPRRAGPPIKIFGRLAPDVSIASAQAELDAVASRAADAFPDTHRHLRPRVLPYVESLWSAEPEARLQRLALYGFNLVFVGLLGVCGANIAALVFARTATRGAEISVRSALGASRARIAAQLFIEALVLALAAAAIGLLVADAGLHWVKATFIAAQETPAMFWWNDQLSLETLAYAGALALLTAAIVGLIPAFNATGARLQEQLRHAAAGASGVRLGRTWTGVIVAQVALTVIFLCIVSALAWDLLARRGGARETTFLAERYLSARLDLDRLDREDAPPLARNGDRPSGERGDERARAAAQADASFRDRFRAACRELERRLAAEPGITAVTYGTRLPGTNQQELRIEVDGMPAPASSSAGLWVGTADVDMDLFDTFGAPIVAGRSFRLADLEEERPVVIVDQAFVRHALAGQEAIGRRVREAGTNGATPGPWLEIVGVVKDLTVAAHTLAEDAVLYRPAAPGSSSPVQLAVRTSASSTLLAPRLRHLAAAVDPSLRLYDVKTLDQAGLADRLGLLFFTRMLAGISAIALLLSTAGVYALMSFTVARRTPEIGIRVALGAPPRRILADTFSRALAQVGLGVLAGSVPGSLLVTFGLAEAADGAGVLMALAVIAVVALFMAGVTMLACAGPARRALRIEPTAALKVG